MITITHKGDFKNTDKFFKQLSKCDINSVLNKYGARGVDALAAATPKRSGETAGSWRYTVEKKNNGWVIAWENSNVNQGVNIALILQYGHGTGTGGYVQGIDYINPALKPVFDALADEAWREVTKG